MEKTEENIKGLAKKVFAISWLAGRVAKGKKIAHEKNKYWIEVWSKGFVPKIVLRIHPEHDMIYACRKYRETAKEFKRQYKTEFLREGQHAKLIFYD